MYKTMEVKYQDAQDRLKKAIEKAPRGKVKKFQSSTLARVSARRKYLEEAIDLQNNKCAICEKTLSNKRRQIHLDHCHTTGTLRGALCIPCNLGLGMFEDDIPRIERIVKYLRKYLPDNQKEWILPEIPVMEGKEWWVWNHLPDVMIIKENWHNKLVDLKF